MVGNRARVTALPPLPTLIGLSGYSGSGKDTLAALLAERCGYQVAHFADPLRELCRRLNPIVGYDTDFPEPMEVRWAGLESAVGYEQAKRHFHYGAEFRGVLQRLGTDAAREVLGQDVWVDAAWRTFAEGERVVFADLRFENEAEAISSYQDAPGGSVLIRVEHPGVGPANGHISETALDDWPFPMVVDNDGTPEWMLEQIATEFTLPEVARG